MFSDYYRTNWMRLLTVVVAMVFSVPYLGIQLRASGLLFNRLLEGTALQGSFIGTIEGGAILLSVVVFIYVASGGLRSVAYVDCAQCILLALGIVVLGFVALDLVGGWTSFKMGLAGLAQQSPDMVAIPSRPESDSFLERTGTLFWDAAGGPWTGLMILTYMFALMGIQSAPAFSMWAFANKDPRPFPWQQVFASSIAIGGILFFFTAFQGLGGAVLDRGLIAGAEKLGVPLNDVGVPISDYLVPYLIDTLSERYPWLVGLLAVCALAAMQSTGAAYMSTASGIITRDLFRHFFSPQASHRAQVLVGRVCVALIISLALPRRIVERRFARPSRRRRRLLRLADVAGPAGHLLHPLFHSRRRRLRSRRHLHLRHRARGHLRIRALSAHHSQRRVGHFPQPRHDILGQRLYAAAKRRNGSPRQLSRIHPRPHATGTWQAKMESPDLGLRRHLVPVRHRSLRRPRQRDRSVGLGLRHSDAVGVAGCLVGHRLPRHLPARLQARDVHDAD